MKAGFVGVLLLAALGFLVGCRDHVESDTLKAAESSEAGANTVESSDSMQSGGVSGLNYTPYYINTFNVEGHDNGIAGGGPNIQPARPDNMPSGGGKETCCATFPAKWRPGLKVTIRWIVNKKMDGIAWGSWYKAEAELPAYGKSTYGMWAIFLPGDRVKVMVRGSVDEGYSNVWTRPTESDPHVVVGIVDDEANNREEARREEERRMKEAYEREVENREKKQ